MKRSPFLDQGAAVRPGARRFSRHEYSVRRHDAQERVRPVRNKDYGAQQPSPVTGLPPCHQAQQEADDSQRRLHGEPVFVGWLPLSEEGAVIEAQTGGLLGDIYVQRRSGEQCGDSQREFPASIITSSLGSADETLPARRSIFNLERQVRIGSIAADHSLPAWRHSALTREGNGKTVTISRASFAQHGEGLWCTHIRRRAPGEKVLTRRCKDINDLGVP